MGIRSYHGTNLGGNGEEGRCGKLVFMSFLDISLHPSQGSRDSLNPYDFAAGCAILGCEALAFSGHGLLQE